MAYSPASSTRRSRPPSSTNNWVPDELEQQHTASNTADDDIPGPVPVTQSKWYESRTSLNVLEKGIDMHTLTWRVSILAQRGHSAYKQLWRTSVLWLLVSIATQATMLGLLIKSLNGRPSRDAPERSDEVVCAALLVLGYICAEVAKDLENSTVIIYGLGIADTQRQVAHTGSPLELFKASFGTIAHLLPNAAWNAFTQRVLASTVLYASYLVLSQADTVLDVLLNGVGILFVCHIDDVLAEHVQRGAIRLQKLRAAQEVSDLTAPPLPQGQLLPEFMRQQAAKTKPVAPVRIVYTDVLAQAAEESASTPTVPSQCLSSKLLKGILAAVKVFFYAVLLAIPVCMLLAAVCIAIAAVLAAVVVFLAVALGPNVLFGYCIFTFPGWNMNAATIVVSVITFMFGSFITLTSLWPGGDMGWDAMKAQLADCKDYLARIINKSPKEEVVKAEADVVPAQQMDADQKKAGADVV